MEWTRLVSFMVVLGGLATLWWQLNSRIDTLDSRIDGLDAKFDAKIDALDAKFDAKFDALNTLLTQNLIALNRDIGALRGTAQPPATPHGS